MKVTLVMPGLDIGGVERVMLQLAEGLTQNGINVDLVVINTAGKMRNDVPKEVQLVDLNAPRVLLSIPQLIKYLLNIRPDVIISAKDYQNIIVLIAVKLSGIVTKVIVTTHVDVSVDWKQDSGFKQKFIKHLVTLCYPWADHIVAVSSGAADGLASMTGLSRSKIKTIYNPIITQKLFELADEAVEDKIFMQENPPIILGVGRLTKQKDFETLIRAFFLILQVRNARLVIIGDGGERPRLENIIRELGLEDNTYMPGFVDNLYAYMKRPAVFVLSSAWEGFPTVLVEAMALGTPVVSTNCPSGPSEILEDGRWGPVVPVGNQDALAKAILYVLEHPLPKDALMKRAKEFSSKRSVENYMQLIKC